MKIGTFNKLGKYESYLTTAYKADYVRGLTSTQINELIEVGNTLGIKYKHNGCPKCVLEFIKKLASPYFEQKDKNELNQKKKDLEKGTNNEKTETE